jgi:hypothetical protein
MMKVNEYYWEQAFPQKTCPGAMNAMRQKEFNDFMSIPLVCTGSTK